MVLAAASVAAAVGLAYVALPNPPRDLRASESRAPTIIALSSGAEKVAIWHSQSQRSGSGTTVLAASWKSTASPPDIAVLAGPVGLTLPPGAPFLLCDERGVCDPGSAGLAFGAVNEVGELASSELGRLSLFQVELVAAPTSDQEVNLVGFTRFDRPSDVLDLAPDESFGVVAWQWRLDQAASGRGSQRRVEFPHILTSSTGFMFPDGTIGEGLCAVGDCDEFRLDRPELAPTRRLLSRRDAAVGADRLVLGFELDAGWEMDIYPFDAAADGSFVEWAVESADSPQSVLLRSPSLERRGQRLLLLAGALAGIAGSATVAALQAERRPTRRARPRAERSPTAFTVILVLAAVLLRRRGR